MRVAIALAFFLLILSPPALAQPADADVVRLSSRELPMIPGDETAMLNGRLRYLGGLQLRGGHRHFSGLSGLHFIEDDTAFLAVNDRGNWVKFTPTFSGERLIDVEQDGFIWPILDASGARLTGHANDSESLVMVGNAAYVSFERRHRIEIYPDILGETNPPALPFREPESFGTRVYNGSLESLTQIDESHLLAFAEDANEDGTMDGWIMDLTSGETAELSLLGLAPFSITDLATLPNGDVVTLERSYSPLAGAGARLRLIAAETIVPGALLDGPVLAQFTGTHSIDNMEGLAVRETDDRIELFIISDNNQNPLQRTLLLAFELMASEE